MAIVGYAKVENGSIVEYMNNLPHQMVFADGNRTGDFHHMDVNTQIATGYYPVVGDAPESILQYQIVSQVDVIEADKVARTYTVSWLPIAEAKTEKMMELNEIKLEKLVQGFEFDGNTYSATIEATQNIQGVMVLINSGETLAADFVYSTSDGTQIPMDNTKFINFFKVGFAARL